MNTNNRSSGLLIAVAFIAGLLIGLFALGWGLFPVQWTSGPLSDLHPTDRDGVLLTTAELYSLDGNNAAKVQQRLLSAWPAAEAVGATCELWSRTADPADQQRLDALAFAINGSSCPAVVAGDPGGTTAGQTDPGGSGLNLGALLALFIILIVLIGLIYFVIQRRNELMSDAEDFTIGGAMPDSPPTTGQGDEDVSAIPLARFQSAYTLGRDNYDDSFSIENSSGDFLGECGVGISESIGTDVPKNVTAFEVWLFDKNDIRTVTKVVMSDHAFFDEALKAKLAPKGDPILARENEVVVLETASLIVNAEIKSMNYGTGALPPQSFFDNFTIELSAWAKEGNIPEADVEGRVDDLLDY